MAASRSARVRVVGSPVDAWLALTLAAWAFTGLAFYSLLNPGSVEAALLGDPLYYIPAILPATIAGAMTWVVYDDARWWRASRRVAGMIKEYARGVIVFREKVSGSVGALIFECGASGRCMEEYVDYEDFEGSEARLPYEVFREMELKGCEEFIRGVLPAAKTRVMGVDVYVAVVDEAPAGRRRHAASRGPGGVAVSESIDGSLYVRAWPAGPGALLSFDCGGRSFSGAITEPVTIEYPAEEPLILVAARGSLSYKRLARALGTRNPVAGRALGDCKPELQAAQ